MSFHKMLNEIDNIFKIHSKRFNIVELVEGEWISSTTMNALIEGVNTKRLSEYSYAFPDHYLSIFRNKTEEQMKQQSLEISRVWLPALKEVKADKLREIFVPANIFNAHWFLFKGSRTQRRLTLYDSNWSV